MLFLKEKVKSRCRGQSIWKGDVVICFVCVRGELITLPRSRYMDRYFGCSFFTTFFLREKESGGKKSAYKGDCAAIRFAPIRRSLPLIYPPMTAQPIATVSVYTRNGRQALSLPFLKERYHVLCISFLHLQSVYTRCCSYVEKHDSFILIVRTSLL